MAAAGDVDRNLVPRIIKIMSYNVWFREDVQVHGRMQAIGRLVQQHCPDLIFFQAWRFSHKKISSQNV